MSLGSVLICGGLGFIGRNLVQHLIEENLATSITVADKGMLILIPMSPIHRQFYENPIVRCIQADLTTDAHLDRVFNQNYNIIINLAAETRNGQSPEVYRLRCQDLSRKIGQRSSQIGCSVFIEVSTAYIYRSQQTPATESGDIHPWTIQAQYKRAAEEEIQSIAGLPWVILRPSLVYGPGDSTGLMPRAVCAAAYVHLHEKMKFLWDENMRMNTVHVKDVCRAIVHISTHNIHHMVYNISDSGNTDQGMINGYLGQIFGIETGFLGRMLSNAARLRLSAVVTAANEKHMSPWSELCTAHQITNTPLSPFIHNELLDHNHLSVDGQAICRDTGFEYMYPVLTVENVRQEVQFVIDQGIFPPVLATSR